MIKKYRKKPVVIEAVQWTGENLVEVSEFTSEDLVVQEDFLGNAKNVVIPTLEGEHIASKGDYIIKGIKGEFYPCKPDIFKATYDLVEGTSQK